MTTTITRQGPAVHENTIVNRILVPAAVDLLHPSELWETPPPAIKWLVLSFTQNAAQRLARTFYLSPDPEENAPNETQEQWEARHKNGDDILRYGQDLVNHATMLRGGGEGDDPAEYPVDFTVQVLTGIDWITAEHNLFVQADVLENGIDRDEYHLLREDAVIPAEHIEAENYEKNVIVHACGTFEVELVEIDDDGQRGAHWFTIHMDEDSNYGRIEDVTAYYRKCGDKADTMYQITFDLGGKVTNFEGPIHFSKTKRFNGDFTAPEFESGMFIGPINPDTGNSYKFHRDGAAS